MMEYKGLIFAAVACVLCACSAENKNETVCKVEEMGGVPRMVLNGEPVRPRMLYVSPTYFLLGSPTLRMAINYPTKWVETFVEIPPLEKPAENLSIQMSARAAQYGVRFASLTVTDVAAGKVVYRLDCAGKDPRVRVVSQKKDAEIKFAPFADVKEDVLWVNAPSKALINFDGLNLDAGKKYRIDMKLKSVKKAFDFDMYVVENGKLLEPKVRSFVGLETKLAKEYGNIDLVTFPVQSADFFAEGDMKPNYENLKGAMDEILAANPGAKILVRIRFYPPKWWLDKYPADNMTDFEGKTNGFAEPMSARFRADNDKALRLIIDYCEKNYGKNVIGYHPGGANSSEWFYPMSWGKRFFGYSDSAKVSWKKWLNEKYKTDADLRKAWRDPSASLASAEVPTPAERAAQPYILDPEKGRKIADFNIFLQHQMFETIHGLAKTIRAKVPNKLSVFFYGYVCEFSRESGKSPAEAGHFALMKVLKSKDFDMLCGPANYTMRDLGDGGTVMSAVESVTRNGKIWIVEDDIRTHRTPPTQQKTSALGKELHTLADTITVLQRNLAQEAVRNNGNWWMDLSGTGWYDDPELWKLMPKFAAMETDMIKHPLEYAPDIAVIGDEYSICTAGTGGKAAVTTSPFSLSRFDFNNLGAPFGHYLLEDALFGKPMNPKLWVFAAAYAMDAKQRAAFRQKTKDAAAMFIWLPAYADLDGEKFSAAAVEEATGFKTKRLSNISAVLASSPEGKAAGLPEKFGFAEKVSPLLSPELKDGDTVLANYENGLPAVVLRGKHLFCGVADIPPALYKFMIKVSGAHVYVESPSAVYANGAYITVTCTDNVETPHDILVNVNSDKDVFDALTGEKLGKGPTVALKMKRGDNRVLRLGKGNAEFVK